MRKCYKRICNPIKLSFILLLLAVTVFARGQEEDENIPVTFFAKNTPLLTVLKSIEKQTGYRFNYSNRIDVKQKVTIKQENVPVSAALSALLSPISYSWRLISRNIYIISSDEGNTSKTTAANNQNDSTFTLTGIVTDEAGRPIIRASVRIKDMDKGTVTDSGGHFTILDIKSNLVLSISSIGYETREVTVRGKNLLVKLNLAVGSLEEIAVVSTGYQDIGRERLTGSVSKPDKKIFANRVTTDVISRLEGITSGVLFNRNISGDPSIEIRGRSTINANATPLIIVDNFPYDGDINNINPNDIIDVNILKDAAAASIWGARAGNGVIVITTKRGKYNQPLQISLTSNLSVSSKPDLNYDKGYLSADTYVDIERNLFAAGFYNPLLENTFTYPAVSPVANILAQERAGVITTADAENRISRLKTNDLRQQISKHFYQASINQQYALSVSAGAEKSNHLLSIGYDNNRSVLQGQNETRFTINNFMSFRPISTLEISGGINFTHRHSRLNNVLNELQSLNIQPYLQLADLQSNALPINRDLNETYLNTAAQRGFLDWKYYPLREKELEDNTSKLNDLRFRAGLNYSVCPGLSIEGVFQYSKGTAWQDNFRSQESYYVRNLVNKYAQVTDTLVTGFNIPLGDILQSSTSQYTSENIRIQANYKKTFRRHDFTGLVGIEQREVKAYLKNDHDLYGYNRENDGYQTVNFTESYLLNPSTAGSFNTIPDLFDIYHTTNRYRSIFANGSYTFNQLYSIYASGRLDQANIFGVKANDRQVPLWSVGAKWDISDEKFYNIKYLSSLQLRLSYGFSGNLLNNGSAYTTARYFYNSNQYFPNEQYQIQTPGNPNLTWEKLKTLNLGIDFSISSDRLQGTLEFYHKTANDLIGSKIVPSNTGFTSVISNYGKMQGKGIDVILNSINVDRSIKWLTSFQLSYTTDKITDYDENVPGETRIVVRGKPVNSIFANRWAGLDPNNGNPIGIDSMGKTSTDYVTLDSYSANRKEWVGRSTPSTFGNLRNSISFKNITLSVNLSYKFGYYFMRKSIRYNDLAFYGQGHDDYNHRWQKTGDEKITSVPSMPADPADINRDIFYTNSSVLATKGDHIRLQDLMVSYSWDIRSKNQSPRSIQLSLLLNNLGIIWKANHFGIDPDYQQAGYIPPKTFCLSVKAYL